MIPVFICGTICPEKVIVTGTIKDSSRHGGLCPVSHLITDFVIFRVNIPINQKDKTKQNIPINKFTTTYNRSEVT